MIYQSAAFSQIVFNILMTSSSEKEKEEVSRFPDSFEQGYLRGDIYKQLLDWHEIYYDRNMNLLWEIPAKGLSLHDQKLGKGLMMDKLLCSSLVQLRSQQSICDQCHLLSQSTWKPESSNTKDNDVFKHRKLPIMKFQSSREEITPGTVESTPNSTRKFNMSMWMCR